MEFVALPVVFVAFVIVTVTLTKKNNKEKKRIKTLIYNVIDKLALEIKNELTDSSIEKRTDLYIKLYSLNKDLGRLSKRWTYSDEKIRKYIVDNYNYPKGTGSIMINLIGWIGFKYYTPEYINLKLKIEEFKLR